MLFCICFDRTICPLAGGDLPQTGRSKVGLRDENETETCDPLQQGVCMPGVTELSCNRYSYSEALRSQILEIARW